MSADLFIYYQVPAEHAFKMQKKVMAMQAALHERWPVAVTLKRRPELKDGCETWMDDFPAALEAAVQDAGLLALIKGGRHVETFIDIPACA
jgi:hypothetical protein